MNELALFAGTGGGILGGKLLGWNTVCAVERDAYAAAVLAQRQNGGLLDLFPIWSDVETFDGKPWRGIVDVVSGGFPCQDISIAGKGAGISGERSGLWSHMARIIGEIQPRYCFVENSPMLTIRGLDRVLFDLAKMGYDAKWGVIGADAVGAKHRRHRLWVLATTHSSRLKKQHSPPISKNQRFHPGDVAKSGLANSNDSIWRGECGREWSKGTGRKKWNLCAVFDQPEPLRMAHGVANRVDRLKAIGNRQVPQVAALAWETLTQRIKK